MKSYQSEQGGRGRSANVVLFKSTHFQVVLLVKRGSECCECVRAACEKVLPAVLQQRGVNSGLLVQQLARLPLPAVLPLGFVHLLEKRSETLQRTPSVREEAEEAGTHQHVQKSSRTFVLPLEKLFILSHRHQPHHETRARDTPANASNTNDGLSSWTD